MMLMVCKLCGQVYIEGTMHCANSSHHVSAPLHPLVEFCNWCDDPEHPSVAYHPHGQLEHKERK